MYGSVFRNNSARWAAIYTSSSIITVINTNFFSNSGSIGASINTEKNSTVKIHNSTFMSNRAIQGPGLNTGYQTSVYITNCTFSCNAAVNSIFHNDTMNGCGGAINAYSNVILVISNSQFLLNEAVLGGPIRTCFECTGGAINADGNVSMVLRNNDFFGNNAVAYGGAILLASNSSAQIISCTYINNTADWGGAVNVQQNSSISILNSTLKKNYATKFGGVILAELDVILNLNNSSFIANSAQASGAVIRCKGYVTVSVVDCEFLHNEAYLDGGVISAMSNTILSLKRCNFSLNNALRGSAFYIRSDSYFYIYGSHFMHFASNIVHVMSARITLNNCIFTNNSLSSFDQVMIVAGQQSTMEMHNSNFTYNKIEGIVSATKSPVFIDSCTFSQNTVVLNGIINTASTDLIINNSVVHNNTFHGCPGIQFENASVSFSSFTENMLDFRYGLITGTSGDLSSRLLLFKSSFKYNRGDVVTIRDRVDVAIHGCKFSSHFTDLGILMLANDAGTLRTSDSSFHHTYTYCIYFKDTDKRNKKTDYMTYNTQFFSGNKSLTSSTKNFLKKAHAKYMIAIYHPEIPYYITQEETEYASGRYCRFRFCAVRCFRKR